MAGKSLPLSKALGNDDRRLVGKTGQAKEFDRMFAFAFECEVAE